MSLFSSEEICIGCKHANWYGGNIKFLYCSQNKEQTVDGILGKCEHKELIEYKWNCKYTHQNDKLEMYIVVTNNCKTFKELRRWWRENKKDLKLISAVVN